MRAEHVEGQRLHFAGVVLPEGEHRDLWVVDGVVRTEPISGAQTVASGGWIMPGLVDAHCHVGLERQGAVSDERAEQQALADRNAGALLLRDAGSPADTRWMDARADLPKIIRAGRHIARPKRYLRNFGEEVEPEELITEVERQAARGDGWVKLVGDWIDRDVGDLLPLWPADLAEAAITRAHELGCRVTAHVFGEQAADRVGRRGDRRHRARHRDQRSDDLAHGRAPGRTRADHDPARQLRVSTPELARTSTRRTPAISALCTPAGSTGSPRHSMRAYRSTPALTRAAFFPTGWSARKLRRWRSSARRSTPWVQAAGERATGSAIRRPSPTERQPIW